MTRRSRDFCRRIRFLQAAVIGGAVSEITGGKFKNGAATAAFSYAVQWGVSEVGSGKVSETKKDVDYGEPENARSDYWANREDLDLKVVDGVLTGEVDVGCKMDPGLCSKVFENLEKVNQPGKINIKFNRHLIYENSSILDIEIKFAKLSFSPLKVTQGDYQRGTKSGFWIFTKNTPAVIRIDYSSVNDQAVILHEFGHAMGHSHMRNHTDSIMSYSNNRRNNFSDLEIDAIRKAYQ